MDLAISLDHAQNFVRIEHTDMVFRIDQRVRARRAVPAEFTHWAFGFCAVDQHAHAEAVAVAFLTRSGKIGKFLLCQPVATDCQNGFLFQDAAARAADAAVCQSLQHLRVFVYGST